MFIPKELKLIKLVSLSHSMKLSDSGVGNMPLTSVPRLKKAAEGQVTQLGVAWSCKVAGNLRGVWLRTVHN